MLRPDRRPGVDVVLDMVAGDYVPREVKCLADDGRIVIIALLGGVAVDLDAAWCCAAG